MWLVATEKVEQIEKTIDPWTLVHLSAGLALGLMEIPRRVALPLAIGYEVVEQVFERHPWGQEFFSTHGPERLPNAVMDLIVFAAGHELGRMWNRTGPSTPPADSP